jgi:hypothetical protein
MKAVTFGLDAPIVELTIRVATEWLREARRREHFHPQYLFLREVPVTKLIDVGVVAAKESVLNKAGKRAGRGDHGGREKRVYIQHVVLLANDQKVALRRTEKHQRRQPTSNNSRASQGLYLSAEVDHPLVRSIDICAAAHAYWRTKIRHKQSLQAEDRKRAYPHGDDNKKSEKRSTRRSARKKLVATTFYV